MLPMRLHTTKGEHFIFCSRYETRDVGSYPKLVFACMEAIYHFMSQFDEQYFRSWCWREMLMTFDSTAYQVHLMDDEYVLSRIAQMMAEQKILCFREVPKQIGFAAGMTPDQALRLQEKQGREERAHDKPRQSRLATRSEEEKGQIEVELLDPDGNQVTGQPYILYGPNGMATNSRSQMLDNIRHTHLIPGLYQVTLGKLEPPWQHINAPKDESGSDSTTVLPSGGSLWATSFETGIPLDELWAYTENDDLKKERHDPNLLQSRDKVAIPKPILHSDAQLGDRKTFHIKRHLLHIRVRLMEHDKPRPDLKCALTVAGTPYLLTSDADGRLNFDNLKISSLGELEQIRLFVEPKPIIEGGETPPTEVYHLNVGNLNPLKGLNGGLQRIWNLGYLPKNDHFPMGLQRDFENLADSPDSGNGWACLQRWREKDINTLPAITGEPEDADYSDLDTATVKAESQLPAPANNTPRIPDKGWYPPQNKLPETDIFACPGSEITIHRRVRLLIDSHMHIQSNNCAPIPLVWSKLPINMKRSLADRMSQAEVPVFIGFPPIAITLGHIKLLNLLSGTRVKEMNHIGMMPTDEIADRAVNDDYKKVLTNSTAHPQAPLQTRVDLMMVMPMDMEYAQLEGYQGKPIYQYDYKAFGFFRWAAGKLRILSDSDGIHYEKPTSPYERKKVYLNKEERALFESYPVQIERTKKAAANHPLRMIPLFHFEPRRWINGKHGVDIVDADGQQHTLDHPFKATLPGGGIFIGYKMYTALGYRPLDDRLPHMRDFYQHCTQNKLPVLCHGTRGGMSTPDKCFYADYLGANYSKLTYHSPLTLPAGAGAYGQLGKAMADHSSEEAVKRENHERAIRWYNANFIDPDAWRPVLDEFPDLYLCLAHFTGDASDDYEDEDGWNTWTALFDEKGHDPQKWLDGSDPDLKHRKGKKSAILQMVDLIKEPKYPNVYVDISYLFLAKYEKPFRWLLDKHPEIKDYILYGSDWFMLELDQNVNDFAAQTHKLMDSFGEGLWERFTHTNPMRFWRYHEWIDDYAKRLTIVIEGLMDASRIEKKKGRNTNLNPLMTQNTGSQQNQSKQFMSPEKADALQKVIKERSALIKRAGVI